MTLTQISSRGVEDTLRWSLGASGSNHYTFTGPGLTGTVNDPTIYLSRGQTYIFENNNSSNAHPFQIQSTSGQGGTAYNTGVTNNGGGGGTEIKITVPHDAPDNLYYQCTAHANMGGTIYITGAVADGSITETKLADDAVTSDKIAANPVLTGTGGIKVPVGNTSERVNTQGMVRFNSSTGLLEYYDGTTYKGLDIGPTVSSVNASNFESSALPTNIVITGSNFSSSVLVKFIGANGVETSSASVTRDSATQVTAQIPDTITSVNEPYKIQVTNTSSGFSGILENAFNIDAAPVFGVASGSLGTLITNGAGSSLTAVTATDDEGDSVTFSVTSGSLPSGITLNSNGTFAGNANAVSSNTTSTFSVTATDGTNTSVRQYTITVNITYVQLSGSGTWSVPSGVNTAEILIVGGGGSGQRSTNVSGAGGGAGGIVHTASYTFTSTDKSSGIAYVVGAGGKGVGKSDNNERYDAGGNSGADTTFAISGGTITAKGGGYGAGYGGGATIKPGFSAAYHAPAQGGSGGGGAWEYGTGATSNQGTFSGWTSYGNSGGNRASGENYSGAGGGGAGGAGSNSTVASGGAGGVGQLFSNFTAYGESGYFGGGGAGGSNTTAAASAGGNGGGGDGGYAGNGSGGGTKYEPTNGVATTGGGGGGTKNDGNGGHYKSGDGGSGTILIRY